MHAPDRAVPPAWIDSLQKSLRHRGPDDAGLLFWSMSGRLTSDVPAEPFRAVLGHRRLAVIDTSSAARQPMSGGRTPADGAGNQRYHLIYNGMIYNYRELRPELETLGWQFRSHSDTEVLLAAWAFWGVRCLERLNGMFAFGLLDTVERRLWLVRDFFGIKPLYFAETSDGIVFASEINALLELPHLRRRANPQRLFQYLRFGLTDDGHQTFLQDIHQLPAAHWMCVNLDDFSDVQRQRYWQLETPPRIDLPFEDAARELRRLILGNVELHMRSDVPLGAALSGGIDSAAIAGALRHVAGPHRDLHAVSYIADAPDICEERWVDMAGQSCDLTVHKLRIAPDDLADQFDALVHLQGEPFGGTSIFAQFRMFQAARTAGLKVMLSGQGADELFGGYPGFLAARLASLIKQGRLTQAGAFLRRLAEVPGRGPAHWLQLAGACVLPDRWQALPRLLAGRALVPDWLCRDWFARRGVAIEPLFRHQSRAVLREQLLQALAQTSLPMLLRFEDRNSMASSIESRLPFLTPALAHFAMSLPEDYLIGPEALGKRILRAALRGIVPDGILDRRDKIGFATPDDTWTHRLFRALDPGAWVAALPMLNSHGAVDQLRRLQRGSLPPAPHHWRWLNLAHWIELKNIEV